MSQRYQESSSAWLCRASWSNQSLLFSLLSSRSKPDLPGIKLPFCALVVTEVCLWIIPPRGHSTLACGFYHLGTPLPASWPVGISCGAANQTLWKRKERERPVRPAFLLLSCSCSEHGEESREQSRAWVETQA